MARKGVFSPISRDSDFVAATPRREESLSMSDYILLVEDDSNIQQFLNMVLSKEGYRVVVASNGASALQITARQEPGLILLDMHMPTMDGATFLKTYQSAGRPRTPVVIVTVDHMTLSSQVRAAADHVLIKPFSIADLLVCVETYLVRH
jgi:DNA-binding response OmpR family regulator